MSWITTIGLEVHVQLNTKSKLFSSASTTFGAKPNTQVALVDLGLPGTLPVINKQALHHAISLGLALGSTIHTKTRFSRKNYMYPDLPKGYQISQDKYPILTGGKLTSTLQDGSSHTVTLTRAHLEEDAGKSVHEGEAPGISGLDFNRAGMPLIEVVTEPVISTAEQAVAFLKNLRNVVRCLKIGTGNMQEGAFRCDVNLSVRPDIDAPLGTRAELKNLNSFRFIEKAIAYEIERQIDALENGETLVQETRLYNAEEDRTYSMRTKENADDYRFFLDPDLPQINISPTTIDAIKMALPELPWQAQARFENDYQLHRDQASSITQDPGLFDAFVGMVADQPSIPPKLLASWLTGAFAALCNKEGCSIEEAPIGNTQLGELVARVHDETLSTSAAKKVLEALWQQPQNSVDGLIDALGLKQNNDTNAIEPLVKQVVAEHPAQHQDYYNGKEAIFSFFVGKVMRASKGQANPKLVTELLQKLLKEPPTA